MDKKVLRNKIRGVIEELYGQTFINYPDSGQKFPYDEGVGTVPSNEIDTDKHYLIFKSASENQDTYEFPYDEFKRGMQVERMRNPVLNFYDHAEMVIKNLRDDKKFYGKFLATREDENN